MNTPQPLNDFVDKVLFYKPKTKKKTKKKKVKRE